MRLLLVGIAVVIVACLIYLVSLVDRLADAAGRNSERLKDIEESINAIKRALSVPNDLDEGN